VLLETVLRDDPQKLVRWSMNSYKQQLVGPPFAVATMIASGAQEMGIEGQIDELGLERHKALLETH
jgi:hypothetical protein